MSYKKRLLLHQDHNRSRSPNNFDKEYDVEYGEGILPSIQDDIKKCSEVALILQRLVHRGRDGDMKVKYQIPSTSDELRTIITRLQVAVHRLNCSREQSDQAQFQYRKVKRHAAEVIENSTLPLTEAVTFMAEMNKATHTNSFTENITVNNNDPLSTAKTPMTACEVYQEEIKSEMQFHHELLYYKENGIEGIVQDIEGIRSLYTELASHVSAQHLHIESIESCTQRTQEETEAAGRHIVEANSILKRRYRRYSHIFIALGMIIAIIILVICAV